MQASRVHLHLADPVAVRLPGIIHPVWVRPGTSDVSTFDEVFLSREYDLPFADFAPRHILDLGANVGYASLYFNSRWPDAAILAVEPELANLILLKRNTSRYLSIATLRGAGWSRPAQLSFENPQADANAFRVTDAEHGSGDASIRAYTVAQLLDRLECDRGALVKMDVEGAEAEILRGDVGWLDRVDVLVIELHDRLAPGCGEALFAALAGRRFRVEIMGANLAFDFRPANP
jgi:FkbM family methyltransferase